MARVGMLTGGGDCPGLNAVIRAAVRRGLTDGAQHSFVGFRHGWAGLLENETLELTLQSTAGILPRGGTILGTSRTDPFAGGRDGLGEVRATLERRGVDALIPIGGEDTLGVAYDRVPATRFGVAAMDAVARGRFGKMVGLRGTEIVEVELEEALREPKLLDPELYETAELFFG